MFSSLTKGGRGLLWARATFGKRKITSTGGHVNAVGVDVKLKLSHFFPPIGQNHRGFYQAQCIGVTWRTYNMKARVANVQEYSEWENCHGN